jgi:hypothetical protein
MPDEGWRDEVELVLAPVATDEEGEDDLDDQRKVRILEFRCTVTR